MCQASILLRSYTEVAESEEIWLRPLQPADGNALQAGQPGPCSAV
jgi:hypothetical protein